MRAFSSFRTRAVFILSAALVLMLPQVGMANVAPVANDQDFYTRASELLAKSMLLAATDADHDPLTYEIVSGPSNGVLIGTPPRLEYLPDSTFRGLDSFTYRASDGSLESNIATVTIDVAEEACTSAQIGPGPTDSLFVHVPSHLLTADISVNQHTVTLTGDMMDESASSDPDVAGHPPFVSRNDLTNKTIAIDLGAASTNVPLSISFKLMPTSDTQNEIVMQSNAFVIEDNSGGMVSTYYDNASGQTSVTNNNSTLKTRSCNHFAVVLGNSQHITYLNGYDTQQAADTSNLRDIDGIVTIGPYPGRVWDIRIYNRILTPAEIMDLGGADCSDELLSTTPYPGYPNYLIGVYIDEWWPDHATEPLEEFQYYLHAQDMVYERNLFEAGMYARDDLCGYFGSGQSPRSLELSDGIRSGFMGYTFSNPLKQSNCDYWMHENFHSYQGKLGGYIGLGMSKFMLESGASWGPDHMIPGKMDTLLAYYSMHPHLPLWTIQDSPVDMRAGWEFKGGHQYGAYICWAYFTNHVANKMWLGDVHCTSGHVQAAHDLLAVMGHDMADHFGDFAARITTWDMQDGAAYRAAELASLNRMINAVPECPRHDNKITTFYDANGTGDAWTSMPEEYIPGAWAWNAYKVENIGAYGLYNVALMTDPNNPVNADFRAQVVVHNTQTDFRTYHHLDVAAPGVGAQISVPAGPDDELYLVVATTPNVFDGWDWYEYQYKIYPVPDTRVLNVYLLAGQSNMEGQAYTYNSAETANWNIPTMEFLLSGSPAATNYLANMPHAFKASLSSNWLNPRDDVWAVHYYSGDGSVKDVLPTNDPNDIVSGIQPLMPGFGVGTNFGSMIGPELGMGIRLGDALQSPVFLFKSDRGGTTLGNDWRPPTAVAARGGVVGPEYTNTITRFIEFLDALDADLADDNVLNGYDNVPAYMVAGVFWFQGWNEQYDDGPYTAAQLQAEYADNLKDLIYSIRAEDARIPDDLPLVIGESSDQNATLNTARQEAVDQLNTEIPGSADFFDTNDMIGVDWGDNDSGQPFSQSWGYHFHARAENFLEIGWKAAGSVLANGFYLDDTSSDTDPPTPDPMTWDSVPAATGTTSITMTATTATDPTGVEYYFTCTAGGGNDSGWQDSATYEDTGLTPDTTYTYTVTARDKSTNQNETAPSTAESATTDAPDLTPPTPDPMTWATAPYATSHHSIAMAATTATDVSGVEYYFTCTAGGGNDSGWQDSTTYEDTGLTPETTYTYTVAARDKSTNQNETAPSTAESATTDVAPPITVDLQGYWPFDGDALDDSGNGHDGTLVNAPGYVAGKLDQAISLDGPSNQYVTAALPTSISPPWSVSVWINKQGPPQAYNASGLMDGGTDANWTCIRAEQYGSGDPPKVGLTKYNAPDNHNHYWNYSLPTGSWAHLVFVCTATGTELFVDNVSQGELTAPGDSMLVWIDWIGKTHNYNCPMDAYLDDLAVWSRPLDAAEIAWLYNGGAGNAVGGDTPTDTDPPTPNPATFAVAPAADSDTAISMTATTGSDATGPVEYYFDEISGNPGGTDSGWQTSPSYTDTGLSPSTQYTYTVAMRDAVTPTPNMGTPSAPANATTLDPPDTDPPTPNPATWAVAPAADSDTAISMTATTGSDATGPVEYYFDETSGNPGGTDSGWQTSPSYTDTGLDPSTQYTYTVQMRDAVSPTPNVGTASSPAGATTDPAPAVPAAPSNLSATAISQTQIDLSWMDNADNETGFKIERSDRNPNNYAEIATVGADVTSFSDTTVRKNTTYYYRVRATNSYGDSAYSNEASAQTPK